jgi:adenosylhomocysteine nucleosidase
VSDRVALICAMPLELVPLRRKLSLQRRSVAGLDLYEGRLGDRPVVATVTGMGTALATRGVERLLAATPVGRVVVIGITGALDEFTPIGSLIRPDAVVDGATGARFRPAPLGPGVPAGTMWTSDSLITDADVLAALRAEGVVSLDMETAAVAAVCERHGIPWSVVRAVSDRPGKDGVDDEIFRLSNQDGTPNGRAVVAFLVKHPGRIPAMARMARGAKLATERAADEAIAALSSTSP